MFGAIAGGIASALAGGAMSKLFGGGQKAASGGIQGDVLATDNNTVGMGRSEERFSRNAETDLVCRLLLEKKTDTRSGLDVVLAWHNVGPQSLGIHGEPRFAGRIRFQRPRREN